MFMYYCMDDIHYLTNNFPIFTCSLVHLQIKTKTSIVQGMSCLDFESPDLTEVH